MMVPHARFPNPLPNIKDRAGGPSSSRVSIAVEPIATSRRVARYIRRAAPLPSDPVRTSRVTGEACLKRRDASNPAPSIARSPVVLGPGGAEHSFFLRSNRQTTCALKHIGRRPCRRTSFFRCGCAQRANSLARARPTRTLWCSQRRCPSPRRFR